MKINLLLFSFIFSCFSAFSHFAGGNITYKPTGIANEYEFTLNLYKGCSSDLKSNDFQIHISNSCGTPDFDVLLGLVHSAEISQICPSQIGNTECALPVGGPLEGREHNVYKGKVQLPMNCGEWTISASSIHGRDDAVNVTGGWFYIESKLDNLNFTCNSSPLQTNVFQIPYVCVNQQVDLASFFIDPDADSLAYSFHTALSSPGTPLTYIAPFTSSFPIAGITISPEGELAFTGVALGNYVIVILIEEFDSLGNLKGSVLHDFHVVLNNCTNETPAYTGAFNFNNSATNALFSNDTIYMGPNDEFCLDVNFSDPDPNAILQCTSNVLDVLPNAIITTIAGNPGVIQICWDFDTDYNGSWFSVETTNDICPVPGVASHVFYLALPNTLNNIPDTLAQCINPFPISFSCFGADLLGWKDLDGNLLDIGLDISCNPCNEPYFLFSTDTTIVVYDSAFPNIQKTIFLETINTNTSVLNDSTFICLGDSITFTGPFPNYCEVWSIGMNNYIQNSITINTVTPLNIYYLLIAQNSCFIFDSTVIVPSSPIVNITNVGLYLESNLQTNYQWLFNNIPIVGETNQSHFPLNNGDYSVIGYDMWNCSDTSDTFTITTANLNNEENLVQVNRFDQVLQIHSLSENGFIQIFDIQGKLILEQTITTSDVTIQLPSKRHTYIIRIVDNSGSIVFVKKL